jgi:hypothetical protein
MWNPELHCFIVCGENLAFSTEEDVYFLTGLPCQGTLLQAEPVIVGEGQLATLSWEYCLGEDFMPGSMVRIGVMDALVHLYMVAMIVRVYGSLTTQRISGGQLRIMQ